MGLGNLGIGAGFKNMQDVYYQAQTFQAFETAVLTSRKHLKDEIQDKRTTPYTNYPIADALSDVRRYDESCSIQRGLLALQDLSRGAATNLVVTNTTLAITNTTLVVTNVTSGTGAQLATNPPPPVVTEPGGAAGGGGKTEPQTALPKGR
jgi:hypothetical protein